MRRAGRKDTTQADIVKALRDIGVTVFVVNQEGLPDLLTHSRGVWLPVETKSPKGKLTPAQQATYAKAQFPVVESVGEALSLFGVLDLSGSLVVQAINGLTVTVSRRVQ